MDNRAIEEEHGWPRLDVYSAGSLSTNISSSESFELLDFDAYPMEPRSSYDIAWPQGFSL
jgi:hypothetical protein